MKLVVVLVGAVLAGACSKSSGDSRSSAAPSASTAPPTATTATTTATITMTPPAGPTAPHPEPPQGDCATLAEKCKKCPPGSVALRACTIAVNAGNMDPNVCARALNNSREINAQCN